MWEQSMVKRARNTIYRWLRWSERYTKTDMLYLTKGGFWLSVSLGISSIITLVLAVAFANLLPKDAFGTYQFVLSLAAIIGAFSLSGLNSAISQAVARGFEGTLRAGFWTHLRWGAITTAFALAVSTYYFINDNTVLAIALFIVATLHPLTASSNLYNAFLEGKREFRTSAVYGTVRNVVPALTLIGILFLTDNPLVLLATYFLSHLAITFLVYIQTLRKYHPVNKMDDDALSYGKHLSAISVLGTLAGQLDKILVFHYLGAVQLAVYSFALAIPLQLQSINRIVGVLALPKLSTLSAQTAKEVVPYKALQLFVGTAITVGVYIIVVPHVFAWIFPQYIESVLYSQLIALSLLSAPAILFSQTLVALRKKRELYIVKIIGSVVRIVLLLTLLPAFGVLGAIITLLVTNVVSFATSFVLFKRMQ